MFKKRWAPTALLDDADRRPTEAVPSVRPRLLGIRGWWRVAKLVWLLLGIMFGRASNADKARRLREFLEAQGGAWVKQGQLLAAREDAFPKEFCDELRKLLDRARAFPFDEAKAIIEEELGAPLDEVFSEFDEQPIAAASVAQVFRARLRLLDVDVAVKVRRPHIDLVFHNDVDLIHRLTRFGHRFRPHLRLTEMAEHLETMLLEELDFRIEAGTQDRARKAIRDHRGVYVPKPFLKFCTRRVLVMEFIPGVILADYLGVLRNEPRRAARWRRDNGIDPAKVAERLYFSGQRQIFEDNLFHADMHAGNIMLLRDSRIALIDFGAVGSLEGTFRSQLLLYNRLLGRGELSQAAGVMLSMSAPLPRMDVVTLKRRMVLAQQNALLVYNTPNIPYHEKVASAGSRRMVQIMGEYRVPPAWEFMRVQRSFVALEESLAKLDPHYNSRTLGTRYLEQRDARVAAAGQPSLPDRLEHLAALATTNAARAADEHPFRDYVDPAAPPALAEEVLAVATSAVGWLGVVALIGVLARWIAPWLPVLDPIAGWMPAATLPSQLLVLLALVATWRWLRRLRSRSRLAP